MMAQDSSSILTANDDLLTAAREALEALECATYAMEFNKWNWNSVASNEMKRSAAAKSQAAIAKLKTGITRGLAEAVCPVCPRPIYGKPGTRDVDVALAQEHWDRAHGLRGLTSRELPALPPTPAAIYIHDKLGPLFDRLQLHQYAVRYFPCELAMG